MTTFAFPKIFHVSHVVDDLDAAVSWYEKVFSPRVWQRSELFGTSLALLAVGDTVLMPMQPPVGVPTAPGRFKERFGTRLHSLALYVDRPVELIDHLRSMGLRLTGSAGMELQDPQDEIWTQPRETPILFEFFEPRPSMEDPRLEEPDWSPAYWRDSHPLGIRGCSCCLVTADPAGATEFLVHGLGGTVVVEGVETPYDTTSTFVTLGTEVTIEVAEPSRTDSEAGRDLDRRATFHAVTFQVADLERAVAHVRSLGIRTETPRPGHAVLRREDCLGVNFRLTDRPVADW